MSKIPIENIYYIILYAWNKTNHKKIIVDRGLEDINTINDVILELFLLEVSKIAKKGLYGEYIDNNYDTDYIKGKVNIKESIYLINPKMNCRYDEFSKNNILNKILKVILNKIYFTKNINNKFKRRIRSLLLEFYEVDNILLDESHFKLV
ncbi:MAG: 5-methylcytosine restriction system specificity protein McrC, partial [Senegalia sp. (in: firmicutes)]|uniref:5-methylcytosine restriction system specificity protein McrC n=1 Tax=Senegalia sp. (in: firmicutes) TaxID=1924098 RepID=UPI003F9A436E